MTFKYFFIKLIFFEIFFPYILLFHIIILLFMPIRQMIDYYKYRNI